MNPSELVFGILLSVAILFVGGYFAWRQIRIRRALAHNRAIAPAERAFTIGQTRRRLLCSLLMVLFGGFLLGWYFIEANLPDLRAALDDDPEKGETLVALLTYYWIAALAVLFVVLLLAGLDFFSTARYAIHQKKLLDQERRTALEIETARLRKHRNGS